MVGRRTEDRGRRIVGRRTEDRGQRIILSPESSVFCPTKEIPWSTFVIRGVKIFEDFSFDA